MWVVLGGILPLIYLYFIFQIGSIQKGIIKNIVAFILISMCTILGGVFSFEYLGALLGLAILILFDLFYDDESFFNQWKWILGFGLSISVILIVHKVVEGFNVTVAVVSIFLMMNFILGWYRNLLQVKSNVVIVIIYLCYLYLAYVYKDPSHGIIVLILAITTFIAFESILSGYNTTFKKKTSQFQRDLLINQYEEIKTVYLNMRGFRHDYHNHIQVLKAHLYMEKIDLAHKYLLELEGELNRIDSRVCSGNLMLDAILNSKIAVAEKYNINVTCKAEVHENLPITDIDLCVILGNLLDNAIESCQKIGENTFIRIYIAIIKKQLYISIQNSAKEELNFNERNYITNKRGNHGLGMKRVQLLIDKYEGYLNLQNEPGIFATEVTLPCTPGV